MGASPPPVNQLRVLSKLNRLNKFPVLECTPRSK
jgi:hypothetical protein